MATIVERGSEASFTLTLRNLETNTQNNINGWLGYDLTMKIGDEIYADLKGSLAVDETKRLFGIHQAKENFEFVSRSESLELYLEPVEESNGYVLVVFAGTGVLRPARGLRIFVNQEDVETFVHALRAEYDAAVSGKSVPVFTKPVKYWGKEAEEECRAELVIFGHTISNAEVTKLLNIQPTDERSKGSVVRYRPENGQPSPMLQTENMWCLASDLPLEASIEQHLEHLLDKLSHCTTELAQLGQTCSIEFSVWGHRNYCHLGVAVDKAIMQRIAALHAELDISFYAFTPQRLETQAQLASFTDTLNQLDSIRALSSGVSAGESAAITHALMTFEKTVSELDDAMQDIASGLNDNQEKNEALGKVIQHAHRLQDAFGTSRLLGK